MPKAKKRKKAVFKFWMTEKLLEEHILKCLVLIASTVSGIVPKPKNARIISLNLHSILQWDAPKFHGGNISYTVRSKR